MKMEGWAVAKKGLYRETLVLRVPREVRREIEKKAKKLNLTVSDIVRLAIQQFLNQPEETVK
jgi:antitoxin component of RelBE/YafQ-DinJ toxin-antitoxin module